MHDGVIFQWPCISPGLDVPMEAVKALHMAANQFCDGPGKFALPIVVKTNAVRVVIDWHPEGEDYLLLLEGWRIPLTDLCFSADELSELRDATSPESLENQREERHNFDVMIAARDAAETANFRRIAGELEAKFANDPTVAEALKLLFETSFPNV